VVIVFYQIKGHLVFGECGKLSKKVYVGNLSFQTSEEQVNDLFSEYGKIESLAWITDRDTGRFRGFCFIEMDPASADKAIEALDGKELDGRNLRVNEARPKEKRSSGGGYGGGNRNNYGGGGNRW
jgi:RNA recognition motif-containing protein